MSLSPLSSGLYSSLFYTRYAGKTSLAKMMVLFLLIGMVTKETHQVRVQSRPFPVYPGWQVQTYDPLVFVQVAFTWQEWVLYTRQYLRNHGYILHFIIFMTHSRLISLIIKKYFKKCFLFLLMHELDIAKLYFSTIILIYQPDGSETSQMQIMVTLCINMHG